MCIFHYEDTDGVVSPSLHLNIFDQEETMVVFRAHLRRPVLAALQAPSLHGASCHHDDQDFLLPDHAPERAKRSRKRTYRIKFQDTYLVITLKINAKKQSLVRSLQKLSKV